MYSVSNDIAYRKLGSAQSDWTLAQLPTRRNHSQLPHTVKQGRQTDKLDSEHRARTSAICEADVERRLVVVHRDERGTLVAELVLGHRAQRTRARRRNKPKVRGPCVERDAEAGVAGGDDRVIRSDNRRNVAGAVSAYPSCA